MRHSLLSFDSFRRIVGDEVYAFALRHSDAEQASHLDEICSESADARVLVAVRHGEVIGFASYTVDEEKGIGEIGLNAVHPDHAGAGVGTGLYEFILEEMKDRGARAATVGTGGDPSHAPARRAYEKAGFSLAIPSVWLYRLL